jgi:hypothetical protein
MKIIKPEMLGV